MSVFRGGLAQLGERLICIQEVAGSTPVSSTNIMLRLLNKYEAAQFVSTRHYSAVMPRLTKYYFGYYKKDKLVGVITFGWGTRPKHTIQKLFPSLDTKDYYENGIAKSIANELNIKSGKPIYTLGLKEKSAGFYTTKDNLPPNKNEIIKKINKIINEKK